MFAEVRSSQWQKIAPGVQAGTVRPGPDFPPVLEPRHLEILFCCDGSLTLQCSGGGEQVIRRQEVLVLSDCLEVGKAWSDEEFSGVCVSLATMDPAFAEIMPQDIEARIQSLMHSHGGCCRVHSTVWTRAAFSVLECICPEERNRYCVMKCLELLYLMAVQEGMLDGAPDAPPEWGYLSNTVAQMQRYMQIHLDEKLTIPALSRQFHISPTAFKTTFRTLYGQPVHSWLLGKRLERGAELLVSTPMTVLQVAQEIGYESAGQFNVVFKRAYGMTPSQYRKMS